MKGLRPKPPAAGLARWGALGCAALGWAALGWAALGWAALGCAAELRTVPKGPRPPLDPGKIVDFPPPPQKVELLPADPGPPCRWMDGHYAWTGHTWEWRPGTWVSAPEQCYLAPTALVWLPAATPSARGGKSAECGVQGTWTYGRGGWSWSDGKVTLTPLDCPGVSPPRLYYFPPRWFEREGGKLCAEPSACRLTPVP